jgi:hydantoinase/carbamoylase family amidase
MGVCHSLSRSPTTTESPIINELRLLNRLDELRRIGAVPAGGVDRPAFSHEDVRAREMVAEYMREADLRVRLDPAANLIGCSGPVGRAAVVLGSHLDTVPAGGAYDGTLGVLAAVEVAQTLHEQGLHRDLPLAVVAFSNEEGTAGSRPMFGSRAMVGQVRPEELDVEVREGQTLAQLLRRAGGAPARIAEATWSAESVAAYLELHIEQGPVLEDSDCAIGVVQGISGRMTIEVVVRGRLGHSGTTPMDVRRDALVAAAEVVLAVRALAHADELVRVATVGDCVIRPGSWNVIPGEATLVVDLRDMSSEAMQGALSELRSRTARIAADTGTTIDVAPRQVVAAAACDRQIQAMVEDAVRSIGLRSSPLPSGAGHDAQWMAELAPMGMIFVPSRGGLSHAPDEYSAPADLAAGANVLLRVALAAGQRFRDA